MSRKPKEDWAQTIARRDQPTARKREGEIKVEAKEGRSGQVVAVVGSTSEKQPTRAELEDAPTRSIFRQ